MKTTWGLRAFVIGVDVAAVLTFASLPEGDLAEGWVALLLLAALSALGGYRPVRFAELKVQFTVSHVFVVYALASLGPFPATICAIATVCGAWLLKTPKPRAIRIAFNLGAQALSAATAGWVFLAMGARPGEALVAMLWALTAATTVFFMTNTGLVAVAVALEKSQPILITWFDSFRWSAVTYFTGLTLAACMMLVQETLGLWGLALAIPPCWLLIAFYQTHRERMQEHRKRIEEVEQLNAALEVKVAERTHELKDALVRIEEANRRLRLTNARLIEASRVKNEFLATVSHELRTPLNAVIGFSSLLGDPEVGRLNERQRELLTDIEESGEHLLSLINDILDVSKIEAAKMQVHRSVVDVPDLMRRSVSMIRPQAGKKELELTASSAPDVRLANIDPGMFRGVLVNLLTNAVKFTPAGGRVSVEVRREGRDLLLEVADTGIGIPESEQERVFEEFFQVDGSYTREHQGTGLGLALVRRMLEMHEGSVTLDSASGRGSRFTCRYPACLVEVEEISARPEGDEERLPPPEAPSQRRRILLVEDDPLHRKLARNALRSKGYDVCEADSAEQALEAVRHRRPDLILMDLGLPGMDGFEATRALKRDPATARILVVALTARSEPRDAERARAAGCAGCITKPIRLARFPAQIESYFAAKESVA